MCISSLIDIFSFQIDYSLLVLKEFLLKHNETSFSIFILYIFLHVLILGFVILLGAGFFKYNGIVRESVKFFPMPVHLWDGVPREVGWEGRMVLWVPEPVVVQPTVINIDIRAHWAWNWVAHQPNALELWIDANNLQIKKFLNSLIGINLQFGISSRKPNARLIIIRDYSSAS